MIRRIMSILSVIALTSSLLYALDSKTFNAKLNLTNEDEVTFYFASSDDHSIAIDTLSLTSDMSRLPVITGKGQFDIVWNAVSSKEFSLFIYSAALTGVNGARLDWTGRDADSNLVLGKSNGYGGSETNKVYTHNPSVKIGNSGYMRLSVETEDLSGKPFSEYTTTLKLELKMV